MKNLFFSLGAVAFITLSSFTANAKPTDTVDKTEGAVPCKWRTVYHHANGDVSYTEWTHGNCNYTDSGTLIPIR